MTGKNLQKKINLSQQNRQGINKMRKIASAKWEKRRKKNKKAEYRNR